MRREQVEQRLLVFRQPEEVILLTDPFRLERRMQRALAVDEIFFLLELLAADAVPTLIHAVVDVTRVVDAPGELGHTGLVPRFGRADEIVERDVEALPGPAELLLHPVAVREWIQTQVGGLLVHVLRVLVVPHQETRVESAEPLVARDDVGADLLVRRSEMRAAVHVIDGGREKEPGHE